MKSCSAVTYTAFALATALGSSAVLFSSPLYAGKPVRAAVMPAGAEVTGLHTNAAGDVFLNAQHPGGKNVYGDDVPPAILGYIAGFDPDALSGEGMAIPDESAHAVVNVANGEYVTFGKAGEQLGSGEVLGGVYNVAGDLMYVSNTPDFNGFIPRDDDSAYLYTAWEGAGRDGASAISRLALSKVDGKWRADLSQSRNVDLSGVDGGAVLCSGDYAESQLNRDTNGDGLIGKATDARAAFLESRRTAAAMGATHEWDKLEGVTSHGNNVYISASAISFTMDKSWGHKDWSTGVVDKSATGDIALNAEGCGATYKSVADGRYNITRIDPYVVGKTLKDGSCDLSLPANPDNILALNNGMLMIGEDAGPKRHVLDMLWLIK